MFLQVAGCILVGFCIFLTVVLVLSQGKQIITDSLAHIVTAQTLSLDSCTEACTTLCPVTAKLR